MEDTTFVGKDNKRHSIFMTKKAFARHRDEWIKSLTGIRAKIIGDNGYIEFTDDGIFVKHDNPEESVKKIHTTIIHQYEEPNLFVEMITHIFWNIITLLLIGGTLAVLNKYGYISIPDLLDGIISVG